MNVGASLGPIEILLFVIAVGVLGLIANELDRLRERGEGVYRPPRQPRPPRHVRKREKGDDA